MLLQLSGFSVSRQGRTVLGDVNLSIQRGELVGLIGANGAGKSSLMEGALGLIPISGKSNLAEMDARRRARNAAYLPQSREIAWPVSVEDLVALGRIPWPGGGRNDTDRKAIDAAISRLELGPYKKRIALHLSGGEQARALIARAVAQDAPLLIADEPVAGLDPAQQLACMRLFKELVSEGRGVLVSIHDLGLAARFCDRLILLSNQTVIADDSPDLVLQDSLTRRAFGISTRRIDTPDGPVILPL